MNSSPAVSIVLPYRDARETLPEAVGSALAQTHGDFELLAIDDGSRDDGPRWLQAIAATEPRLRPLATAAGERGLVSALNLGLRMARSQWVARMDADDRMHPQRLQRQLAHASSHPHWTLIACQARLFPEQIVQTGMREYMRWQNACLTPEQIATEIYVESPFVHPSVMFRRSHVLELGGYRPGDFPEDYDLWLRLHRAGRIMGKLPEILLDWRESPQRLSRTDPRCSRQAFDRLRARYLATDPRLKDRPLAFWGAGKSTRQRARHLMDLGYRPTAWIDIDPRKIGNRIDGIPVVPPAWLRQPGKPFVLGYVARHGAREIISTRLIGMSYRQGQDWLMVG
ncbi:MAG: glycosyltransferase [Chromatiales bacterium]|nr:glycosyltransferase [Chromatiales bacterium]